MEVLFTLCATLLSLLVTFYIWKFKWSQRRVLEAASKLPCPWAAPLLGNAYMAFGGIARVTKFMNNMATDYGGLCCVWIGPVPLFIVSNADDLKIILNSSKTLEKDDGYNFIKPFLGNGLITAPAHIWKRNRRVLNPVFHPRNLQNFLPTLNKNSVKLVEKLKVLAGNEESDVSDNLLVHFAQCICQTVLGLTRPIDDAKLYHRDFMKRVTRLLMFRFVKVWLAIDWIFYFLHGRDMKEINCIIDMLINEINKDLKSERKTTRKYYSELSSTYKHNDDDTPMEVEEEDFEDEEPDHRNFREILMDLMDSDPLFTQEDMKFEIITTLSPGADSVTSALSFCLLSLANLPEIQEKLFNEIQTVSGDVYRDITLEDLKRMHYLESVIKETLRRHRIVPFVARKATEDIKLTTSTIPAGGRIIININGLDMNPNVFPHPEKFDPERFLEGTSSGRDSYSFIPFSAGPRNCIGRTYAMMVLKVTLIHIVRNFRLSTNMKLDQIIYKIEASMGSQDGFPIRFELRK